MLMRAMRLQDHRATATSSLEHAKNSSRPCCMQYRITCTSDRARKLVKRPEALHVPPTMYVVCVYNIDWSSTASDATQNYRIRQLRQSLALMSGADVMPSGRTRNPQTFPLSFALCVYLCDNLSLIVDLAWPQSYSFTRPSLF